MERLKDKNYLLFTYHHVATTIFYQPKKDSQLLVDLM